MNQAFVAWDPSTVKNGCIVTGLEGVDRVHGMMLGEPFQAKFPANATFRFDPDFKRNTVLVDCVLNVENMMLCSQRVKDFVMERNPEALEALPVTLLDHKRKPVEQPYFILHPTDPPDCIAFANSKFQRSAVDPDSLLAVQHLEIDASKVPAARQVFRAKSYYDIVIVRRELAEALKAAGFTGAGWKEIR